MTPPKNIPGTYWWWCTTDGRHPDASPGGQTTGGCVVWLRYGADAPWCYAGRHKGTLCLTEVLARLSAADDDLLAGALTAIRSS